MFPKLKRKGSRLTSMHSQISTQRSITDEINEEHIPTSGLTAQSSLTLPETQQPSFNSSLSVQEEYMGDDLSIGSQNEDEATDYVFRIINTFKPETMRKSGQMYQLLCRKIYCSLEFPNIINPWFDS